MSNVYNLKQELLQANERILTPDENGNNNVLSLLGKSALSKPDYNSAMRINMFTSHLNQFLNLQNPHFPKVYFGAENVVGEYSSGYKENKNTDKKVYRKIVKYEKLLEKTSVEMKNAAIYQLFLYDEKNDMYSVVERKPCEDLTEIFGYDYDNSVIDSYEEGDIIPKNTVMYRSKSYDDYMNYRYGQNVPMMYTLDPVTHEDAALFSDEFAEEFMSSEIETIKISLNNNDFLLNMFGKDIDHYQSLPRLGQPINGVLAVSRRLYNDQILYDFRNRNLNRTMEGDSIYYADGIVLDYTIYCNNPELAENTFNRDILKYLKHQKMYWKEIYKTCKEIKKSGSKYSRDIDYLYKRAVQMLDDENSRWRDGDSEFGNIEMYVLVAKHVGCNLGQKCSPRYGNKSVASKIVPKKKMPYYYDNNGNKVYAKVLLNLLAIINRTTAYPLFELALTFIEDKCARYMQTLSSREEQEHVFFELLEDFDPEYNRESQRIYYGLSEEDKDDYMHSVVYGNDIYSNGIFLKDTAFTEKVPIFYRILNIYNKYKDTWLKTDRVYIHKWGREIPVLNKCRISEMYFMKLKQTSRKGFSARNMGAVNSKGLPERSYKSRSHLEKTSSTAIRFGEYETLNFTIGQETDDLALFHALYRTSIKGREDLAKIIMDPSLTEADISDTYDSRTAEILSVIMLSLSVGIEFSDSDNELSDIDTNGYHTFNIDGRTYLCNELDGFMLERISSLEHDLMKSSPIMDKTELYDTIKDYLLNGNYLMGVSDEDDINRLLNMYFE